MSKTRVEVRDERLQKLFADCQQQVISQVIGPFGLSTAMFADKNGGNVTTLHNFSRADNQYVATENDQILHEKSKESSTQKDGKSQYNRKEYELNSKEKASKWNAIIQNSEKCGYTDNPITTTESGSKVVKMPNGDLVPVEVDHIISINEISKDPKMFLGLGQVKNGTADVGKIRDVANNDANLVATNKSLNASKKANNLEQWMNETNAKTGKTNAETQSVIEENANAIYEQAQRSINSVAKKALFKKQATELLHTGGMQALQMGGRQALGLLLTELVNGLFNEFKLLIRHGVEIGKTLIQEITERLKKVAISVAKKMPDALSQGLQGGVSGFASNLLTFLINTFLSTAKRFVTVIREGLLGLYRAFKMIFFPPEHMTPDQALQEGIKILTAVVTTATGFLLQEAVTTFVSSMPFLLPVAEALSAVIIGIITGLLSAFLAYQIDSLFDRLRFSHDEKMMDQLMADTKGQNEFASALITLTQGSLDNVRLYSEAANLNEEIAGILQNSKELSDATLDSLRETVAETDDQVKRSWETVAMIEDSQRLINSFLDGEE